MQKIQWTCYAFLIIRTTTPLPRSGIVYKTTYQRIVMDVFRSLPHWRAFRTRAHFRRSTGAGIFNPGFGLHSPKQIPLFNTGRTPYEVQGRKTATPVCRAMATAWQASLTYDQRGMLLLFIVSFKILQVFCSFFQIHNQETETNTWFCIILSYLKT